MLREGAGFIATPDEFTLVSNALLVPDTAVSDLERILPAVGIAVLFGEDFFARSMTLPGIRIEQAPELWGKLRSLLDPVGLWLAVETGDHDEQ